MQFRVTLNDTKGTAAAAKDAINQPDGKATGGAVNQTETEEEWLASAALTRRLLISAQP
jgi:hypothetical protein